MYTDVLLSQRFLPERGGSITWIYETYRRWPHPVEVITHDYGEAPDLSASNLNIRRSDILMYDWGLDRIDSLKRYFRMYKLLRNLKKKSEKLRIHCTHAVPEVLASLPLRLFAKKNISIVCYAHGEEITACESSRQLRLLYKKAINASDLIIANSKNTKELLLPYIEEKRISVINPGVSIVDKERIATLRGKWRKENNINDSEVVILSLGRLEKRKNLAAVIATLNELKDALPNFTYLIAGSGNEEANLKQLSKSLEIDNKITFLGEVDDKKKQEFYAAADVFVMPSIKAGTDVEGFGIVFLEAAAFKTPAISGNIGGQEEAVIHEKTGLVIDGTNKEALKNALLRLIENPALRESLGEKAALRAQSFSWDRVAEKTYQACKKLSP